MNKLDIWVNEEIWHENWTWESGALKLHQRLHLVSQTRRVEMGLGFEEQNNAKKTWMFAFESSTLCYKNENKLDWMNELRKTFSSIEPSNHQFHGIHIKKLLRRTKVCLNI